MIETKSSALPLEEENWKELDIKLNGASLLTSVSLVKGEILEIMDERKESTLIEIVNQLDWPQPIILMGIGGLINEGLVSAVRHNRFILLKFPRT